MSSGPSNDPVVQQLQLLLTGYGYNFYNTANQARADDLLVRGRASYFLSQAVSMLAQLRNDYSTRFIPPLTRANPDPPQEIMAQIREIESVQQALSGLESHIRGMSVPTQDRIWWRFRQEQALLMQLLNFDLSLVRSSEQIYQYVSQLTPEMWNSQGSGALRQMTQQLTRLAQERERFLLLPL
ncbi:MAG TPA: hypothetical protein VJ761_00630 [Ktedonobacteraceae bacterium]|nr:hypothetical protein [Ktedonobacteraceae bacterium]